MKITSIKTKPITFSDKNLTEILDKYIDTVPEKSIVVITSKIVAICEGRILKMSEANKQDLIEREAEFYLPPETNSYGMTLTIKNGLLIPTAGIDESNGDGYFILWPKDPQDSANKARAFIKNKFNLSEVGVLIVDSKTSPLRWGTTGCGIAFSGFLPLKNYIGKKDIFERELKITKANIVDALSAAATLVMGEGNEQTPISIIEDLPFVQFKNEDPTIQELSELKIDPGEDIYSVFFKEIDWQKGKS